MKTEKEESNNHRKTDFNEEVCLLTNMLQQSTEKHAPQNHQLELIMRELDNEKHNWEWQISDLLQLLNRQDRINEQLEIISTEAKLRG